MKALVLTAYGRLEIQELPRPEPGPRDVRVRVRACGICGSDVHGYDGSTGRRVPPLVMGHEAAGEVEAVGAEVAGFKPGDRVTFDSTIHCGECRYCRAGRVNLCDRRRVVGVAPGDYRQDGAFAECVVVPERIVCRVPDAVPFEHAAMVEPLAVAVHAVRRAGLAPGDRAVVVGCGMIGLLTLQAAKAAGAAVVVATDLDPDRLAQARRLGADVALGPGDDIPGRVGELTGGQGLDVAFEAVGASAPIGTALACLKKGGTLVLIGNVTPRVEVDLQAIVTREIALLGTCASNGEYPEALDLLARGAVRLDGLISRIAPLEEGPAWFERLYAREPGLMKVILKP
jgi:L-iditol 2-dehydrogenase